MTKTRARLNQLAAEHHRAPIGTHLILHEKPDVGEILLDGERLGAVIAESAARFGTPLGVPLMDLTLEKEALLLSLGIEPAKTESFHFDAPPEAPTLFELTPRMKAACGAIRHAAGRPGLLPMGMGIGPFSLMTKLVADPITPVFLAGAGSTAEDEPEVAVVEAAIRVGTDVILAYMDAQAAAGATAFILCEPAANNVYFSPNQLEESYEVFDRLVMDPLRRIKAHMDALGMELVFHDCGELTDGMVERFSTLDPAMISLGSSRDLAADAALVRRTTVLYGNLPTKKFISPQLTVDEVRSVASDIAEKVAATGHPFILGSECDVLSVPGKEAEIMAKVEAFLR
jgi:uroporphyrinogen-III decarboxylase